MFGGGPRYDRALFHAQIFLPRGEISKNRLLGCGNMGKSLTAQWGPALTSSANKPPLIPESPRRRRGRPSREEAVRRELATVGCDVDLVDPLRVLASIAGNVDAAPTARVAAAKALIRQREGKSKTKLSARARAARAAARAGGRRTGWGSDLDAIADGRRQQ